MNEMYQVAGVTNVGSRYNNEDALIVLGDAEVLVVADGMGGHERGEVASALVLEAVCHEYKHGATPTTAEEVKNWLRRMLKRAHEDILKASGGYSAKPMGTTCTVARRLGNVFYIAWLGDSRGYEWFDGVLRQVNWDHNPRHEMLAKRGVTLTQEELDQVRKFKTNVVSRCLLGRAPAVGSYMTEPEFVEIELKPGAALLICSDGFNDSLDYEEAPKTMQQVVGDVLSSNKGIQESCEDLVDAAKRAQDVREAAGEYNFSGDNITAILVRLATENS